MSCAMLRRGKVCDHMKGSALSCLSVCDQWVLGIVRAANYPVLLLPHSIIACHPLSLWWRCYVDLCVGCLKVCWCLMLQWRYVSSCCWCFYRYAHVTLSPRALISVTVVGLGSSILTSKKHVCMIIGFHQVEIKPLDPVYECDLNKTCTAHACSVQHLHHMYITQGEPACLAEEHFKQNWMTSKGIIWLNPQGDLRSIETELFPCSSNPSFGMPTAFKGIILVKSLNNEWPHQHGVCPIWLQACKKDKTYDADLAMHHKLVFLASTHEQPQLLLDS